MCVSMYEEGKLSVVFSFFVEFLLCVECDIENEVMYFSCSWNQIPH